MQSRRVLGAALDVGGSTPPRLEPIPSKRGLVAHKAGREYGFLALILITLTSSGFVSILKAARQATSCLEDTKFGACKPRR